MKKYKYENVNDLLEYVNSSSSKKIFTIPDAEDKLNYSNERIRNAFYILNKDKEIIRIEKGMYIKNIYSSPITEEQLLIILNIYFDSEFIIADTPVHSLAKHGLTNQLTNTKMNIHSLKRIKENNLEERVNKVVKSIYNKRLSYKNLYLKKNYEKIVSKYFSYTENFSDNISLFNDVYKGILEITQNPLNNSINKSLPDVIKNHISTDIFYKIIDSKYKDYFLSISR